MLKNERNKMKNGEKTIGIIAILVIAMIGLGISLPTITQAAEGDVWLTPTNQTVGTSQNFDMEVHMDTGGKDLGAFNMYFDFEATEVTVDTTQGTDGIDKGTDTSSYTILSNPDDIANGHFRFAGMTASSYANGSDVHLVTIHAQSTAGFTSGTSDLDLRVNELSDEIGQALTGGTITGGIITFDGTNAPPTDITLSSSTIDENQSINTVVGTLATTDPDIGDTHTYSFACATPGTNDGSFNISSNNLRSSEIFDYETTNSYAICVRTDDGTDTYDENFTITVNDLDEVAPTLAEITPVPTPTSDNTPSYTFSSTEAGTITYGGDCSSTTTNATTGNNTITFNALANGTYNNCTIIVTDSSTNASDTLSVAEFEVDATTPVYRFWSPQNRAHFFTISESEKDNIIATYTEQEWRYEGIGFYVPN